MFCKDCGKENKEGAHFCKHCGKKINIDNQESDYPSIPERYKTEYIRTPNRINIGESKKDYFKDNRRKIFKISAIIAIAAIISYFVYSSNNGSPFPEKLDGPKTITYEWKYNGKIYSLAETLYKSIYDYYHEVPEKTYNTNESFEAYYKKIISKMEAKEDNTISVLADSIKKLGNNNGLSDDDIVELAVSFIQSIPYDEEKYSLMKSIIENQSINNDILTTTRDTWPRLPYESLFDNKGICSDKTILTVALLNKLGFGTAIFDFPDNEHVAPGVKCATEYSTYKTGYCLIEVTNVTARIGEVTEIEINSGIGSAKKIMGSYGSVNTPEPATRVLEKANFIKITDGKEFTEITQYAPKLSQIDRLEKDTQIIMNKITTLKAEYLSWESTVNQLDQETKSDYRIYEIWMDEESYATYKDKYNVYLKAYNQYKSKIDSYNTEVNSYNKSVDSYNALIKEVYGIE